MYFAGALHLSRIVRGLQGSISKGHMNPSRTGSVPLFAVVIKRLRLFVASCGYARFLRTTPHRAQQQLIGPERWQHVYDLISAAKTKMVMRCPVNSDFGR